MSWTNVFLLFGGLGFFLYGMTLMSEGMEKVAGAKMRKVLALCTKNRFVGTIVGLLFTAVIQSSSATTVMVVSFVNSGLITLKQAVGPILGANIGTTVTGVLVGLNLETFAPLFIILGVIMVTFCKRPMVQKVGEVILGFGILFYGMSVMKDSMSDMSKSQAFNSMLTSLQNPLAAVLAGLVITTILQSSSASTGIMIAMASKGLLSLPICMYMLLGCNMGTCTSALLASLNAKKEAKRTAMVHMLFNVFSTIITVPVLLIWGGPIASAIGATASDAGMQVANTNVIFKIIHVLILFPLAGLLVKTAQFLIPGDDKRAEKYDLKYIGSTDIFTPATVDYDITREIRRMGKIARDNLELSGQALLELDSSKINKVLKTEGRIDVLCREITDYLVSIASKELPFTTAKNLAAYFHVVSDFERIGDHAENLAEFAEKRIAENIQFSQKGIDGLKEMLSKTVTTVDYAIEMFAEENMEHKQEIVRLENEVDDLEERLQLEHVERLAKNECAPGSSIYSEILSNLERASDHATNIAFAIHKQEKLKEFQNQGDGKIA